MSNLYLFILVMLLSMCAADAGQSFSSEPRCNCKPQKKKWVYFDEPINFGYFAYKTYHTTIFPFKLPIDSKTKVARCKIILFLRTGHELNKQFWTKIRVIDRDD